MSAEKRFIQAACDVPVRLETPIKISDIKKLQVGDVTSISGEIYTARDRAHIKIRQNRNHLPFNLAGACVYHSGPIIIKSNEKYKVVAAGPTTSARMNEYIPDVVKLGVRAIIGKGGLSDQAVDIMEGRCLYLAFTGGCGALAQRRIVDVLQIYYPELGETEAVWKLKVENFGPLVVAIDSYRHSLYKEVETYSNRRLHELVGETSTCCR
jgi:tartrate/fumarate subfamily iron-sulfur-dependent hydro-lyase beta chain